MNVKSENLKGKNILITGASRGIGKYLTKKFSSLGVNVIMLSKNEETLDLIYDEIKEKYKTDPCILKCDLENLDENKAQEIANVISENYDCLDALINNAAILGKMSSIMDYDLKTWEKAISTNLTSSFLLSKYLIPILKHSQLPRLIFTSSGVALEGKAYWGAYSVSKAGLKALSEILKEELETIPKLKVFNFNPKATRTEMRALAFPAEDPNSIKKPDKLIDYYLWMLSNKSSSSFKTYVEFGDKI
ncbi:MAG: polyketide synthase [Gammaproteobacteria bacterium]|nr:polyketide synthase [Gammaproteobacteria bacterium]